MSNKNCKGCIHYNLCSELDYLHETAEECKHYLHISKNYINNKEKTK